GRCSRGSPDPMAGRGSRAARGLPEERSPRGEPAREHGGDAGLHLLDLLPDDLVLVARVALEGHRRAEGDAVLDRKRHEPEGAEGSQYSPMPRTTRGGSASSRHAHEIMAASSAICPAWLPIRSTRPGGMLAMPCVSTRNQYR